MPPTQGKKVMTQPITEPAPEPIQSSAIVVIQPGSSQLRLGRAADAFPFTIPHVIARRHKTGSQVRHDDKWLLREESRQEDSHSIQRAGLRSAREALQNRPTTLGQYREATDHKQLAELHQGIELEVSDVLSPNVWSNTQLRQEFIIGKEALHLAPEEPYDLHWPIQHGRLNLHGGSGGTLTSVLQDLHDLWSYAIQNTLDIPIKDLKHYRAALLIPDIYNRTHVREIFDILFKLGFGAAFIVQESVCATFGTGVSSACVVDIGDQKTAVCCVEDGLSLKNTRMCMETGGSDVTRCFHWLLSRSGFPYKECQLADSFDAFFLQELKETYCHLDQDVQGYKECHIQIKRPSEKIRKFTIQMGDERILSSLSVFFPNMFGLSRKASSLCRVAEDYYSDPSDPLDEQYVVQTRSKHEQAARALAQKRKEASGAGDVDAEAMDEDEPLENDHTDTGHKPSEGMSEVAKLGPIGIDRAILESIDKCENDEIKKRMYSCILVVGGGLMFPAAQSWLQYLVWTHMPGNFRLQLETQDVITSPKDMDPRQTCWKGCAIMCCLDTTQELWVRQREWKKYGVKILRERTPFLWTD